MKRRTNRTGYVRAAAAIGVAALAVTLATPAFAQTTVKCESKDGSKVSCPADTSQGVMLSKQLSTDGCWKDESWGTDAKGIWVSDHCGAEFTVAGGGTKAAGDAKAAPATAAAPKQEEKKKGGSKTKLLIGGAATAAVVTAIAVSGDDNDDNDNDRGYRYDGDGDIVRCESSKDRRTTCPIGNNTRVELTRQLSEADCRKGHSWGTNSDSIWVDNGCRGDFRVKSNDRNERVQRNEQTDAQRAKDKANTVDKNKAKDKIKKDGDL